LQPFFGGDEKLDTVRFWSKWRLPVRFFFENGEMRSPMCGCATISASSLPFGAARELSHYPMITCGKSLKMLAPKGGARASPREHSDYSLLANDLQQKNARAALEWYFVIEAEPSASARLHFAYLRSNHVGQKNAHTACRSHC